MRQVQVNARTSSVDRVLEIADEHGSYSPAAASIGKGQREDWSILFLNLPNDRVGPFVWAVREEVDDAEFVLSPYGVLPVQTPVEDVETTVLDVAPLSTLELVLSSQQSVGSWQGLLLYALFSGVIAAYGVIFNIGYLLVAAMLIAPMGAPVMVSVIGGAIGDWRMFGRGAVRFAASIAVLVAAAAGIGIAYDLSVSTEMMEQITSLSTWGVAVALVAGAAGAQSQVQSERASLVTGTATGFLIAAALSPTSAVLGLSLQLGRWDYTGLMSFQLVLQFSAISAGGMLALRLYGVRPGDPSLGRGEQSLRIAMGAGLALAIAGLLVWQLGNEPRFRKADFSNRAVEVARDAIESVPQARMVSGSANFTRPDLESGERESLLLELIVQRSGVEAPDSAVEQAIRNAASRAVVAAMPGVVPIVSVTVVP